MIGRRVHNKEPHELQPGDYGRWAIDAYWYAVPPGTDLLAGLAWHTVTEHEDGTITVSPSTLVQQPNAEPPQWHGFLERGVWRRV
jgi:hypothetical protein